MPIILRYKGYKIYFFSNEGDPREPIHVHVRQGGAQAKFWLEPQVSVAKSFAMTAAELRDLTRVIEDNRTLIERSWYEFFGE